MSDNVDLMVGRCRDCKFSKTRYDWGRNREQRVVCSNEKVFGIDGMDSDGAEQWEAAELHMGLDFGCIHFTPNAMGDSLPPQEKNNE